MTYAELEKVRSIRENTRLNTEGKPSEVTEVFWLLAYRQRGEYPRSTERSGKWLIFVPVDRVDENWAWIKKATEDGLLGGASKVATAKENPNTRDPRERVICVYTYDCEDYEDVHLVREELRRLGYEQKMSYKTDQATREGRYSHKGHSNVTKYRE